MQIFPLAQIFWAVKQDTATLFANAGGDTEIPEVALAPQKRIAETGEQGIDGRLNHRSFPFGPGAKLRIVRSGQALDFAKIAVTIAQRGEFGTNGFHSGVEKSCGAMVVDGAACEAAISIVPAGRGSERDRQMLPMNHVGANGVGPVHFPPNGGARGVLEK